MEFADLETNKSSAVRTSYEIRLEDFKEYKGFKERVFQHRFDQKNIRSMLFVSIYPNGFNEETEGWLTIFFNSGLGYGAVSCTVNVIDIEGYCRYPRSFRSGMSNDITKTTGDRGMIKYLERSSILSREDEFLPKGVLTMRCDYNLDLSDIVASINAGFPQYILLKPGLRYCTIKSPTADLNDSFKAKRSKICTVADHTSQILTLPQFHESRKRFGVYGIPPESPSLSSESKEDIADTLEHIWMFDVLDNPPRRHLLSLDERQDSLGTRLLKASPVIRRMVSSDMRERREKCIELQNVKETTFQMVLNFLENGPRLTKCLDLYKFSHFYGMEDLQRACAESLTEALELPAEFEEIERMIDFYSDEYLSSLLESRRTYCENLKEPQIKTEDIPYSDCFI